MSTELKYLNYLLKKRSAASKSKENEPLTPDEEKDLIFLLTKPGQRNEIHERPHSDRFIKVAPVKIATRTIPNKEIPARAPLRPIGRKDIVTAFPPHIITSPEPAVLEQISTDYLWMVTFMRWIEFLLERVPPKRFPLLLDYYIETGWISNDVKRYIMKYARGNKVHASAGVEPLREEQSGPKPPSLLGKWKLSTEDHLRSFMFINFLAGNTIDKERLNSLEQNIEIIKKGGDAVYGI